MKLREIFELKQRIDLKPENAAEYYVSSIQEIKEDRILIDMPYLARRPLLLQSGTWVKMRFIKDDGVYQFDSQIMRFYRDRERLSYYEISIPEKWEYNQRRQLYRLNIVLDVELIVKDLEAQDKFADPKVIKGKSANLSGNGVKVITAEYIPNNQEIMLILDIPEVSVFKIPVAVAWSRKEIMDGKLVFHTGLKFKYISIRDQDAIVQFIFRQEAKWGHNNRSERRNKL